MIKDNTIVYRDDKNVWSYSHYLGVARSSLLEASSLLPSGYQMFPSIVSLNKKMGIGRYLQLNTYQRWELLLMGFDTVVDVLNAKLDGPNMTPLL